MPPNANADHDPSRTHRALARLAARQCGIVGARQLRELGLGQPAIRARVRAGRLFEVLPRVYSLSPAVTEDGLRAAALLACSGWAALGSWSAAELLAMADRPAGPHHVMSTRGPRSIPGRLVVHRVRAQIPVRHVRGFPVTEPGRVLLDLAVRAGEDVVEDAVGQALHRRLLREDDLLVLPARYPGHPGLAAVRAVSPAAARRRRTESPLEREVRAVLDALPISPFVCQHRVCGASGKPYRADFAWPELGVILEADGRSVHARLEALEADHARDADLTAAGVQTVRVTRRQLRRERRAFVASLLGALAQGATRIVTRENDP